MSSTEDGRVGYQFGLEPSKAFIDTTNSRITNQDGRNRSFERHRICTICADIVSKSQVLDLIAKDIQPDEPLVEVWPHHANEIKLRKSISEGCHLCHLLYTQTGIALSKYYQIPNEGLPTGQIHLYLSTRGSAKVRHPRGRPRFHFEFGLGKPNQKDGKIRPHEPLLLDRELSNPPTLYDSFLTASTGSDAAFGTLNTWMSQCLKQHKHCSNRGEFPVHLPRRLLKLSGLPHCPQIKLTEIYADESSQISYLTLSHCWGSKDTLKLQQSNYPLFLESIDFSELPQLFKDAVFITLKLGFEYLWIDAMCIVQDWDKDWDEALHMSQVFGNSACTISALAAEDGNKSCMYDRSSLTFLSCRVTTVSGECLDLVSWRARELLGYEGPNNNTSALNQRAWVMQERYLTPRNVYFGKSQLWWQCCEASFSEFRQTGLNATPFLRAELRRSARPKYTITKPIFVKDAFWGGQISSGHTKMDWHSSWWILIDTYFTAGRLSREEDRWPAISGIAHMVEIVTGVRMLSGMWMSHLMFDLLWSTYHDESNRRIDNGQPSWSWLSVTGRVYQIPIDWKNAIPVDQRFTAKILEFPEAASEPSDRTLPYFYLASQPLSLLIQAPMMKFPEFPEGKAFEGETEPVPEIKNGESVSSILGKLLLWGYNCWNPDYEISPADLANAWVLQWTRQENRDRVHRNHTAVQHQRRISGLIVRPLNAEQSSWCRVGRFTIRYGARKGKVIGPLKTIRLY